MSKYTWYVKYSLIVYSALAPKLKKNWSKPDGRYITLSENYSTELCGGNKSSQHLIRKHG